MNELPTWRTPNGTAQVALSTGHLFIKPTEIEAIRRLDKLHMACSAARADVGQGHFNKSRSGLELAQAALDFFATHSKAAEDGLKQLADDIAHDIGFDREPTAADYSEMDADRRHSRSAS